MHDLTVALLQGDLEIKQHRQFPMKISSKAYWVIAATLSAYFCYLRFKGPPPAESGQVKVPVKGAVEPQSPTKYEGFTGRELLSKLGVVLSASMLEVLQKTGDLPEVQAAALEKGGKNYAFGVNSGGGGLVMQLGADNALLAFGFALNAAEAPSGEEQRILAEFKPAKQSSVTVLDERFELARMQIQTYESKALPKHQALAYSKGGIRTLVFFDSTRVERKKLLPASPETMDPAMLKQLRSLVE